VRDGLLLASGQNRVTRDLDPTAHAEVQAIRAACASVGDFSLAGCVLSASSEPCPLGLSAALWARVDRVVFAADRDERRAGASTTGPSTSCSRRTAPRGRQPVQAVPLPAAETPFDAWLSHPDPDSLLSRAAASRAG